VIMPDQWIVVKASRVDQIGVSGAENECHVSSLLHVYCCNASEPFSESKRFDTLE
jgi:hypothetical protein